MHSEPACDSTERAVGVEMGKWANDRMIFVAEKTRRHSVESVCELEEGEEELAKGAATSS